MWTCTLCGESVKDTVDTCWRCSTPRSRPARSGTPAPPVPQWHMCYQVFRGGAFTTWERVFAQAAEFSTLLGPERVISISHSEDQNQAVVTVWYWSDKPRQATP